MRRIVVIATALAALVAAVSAYAATNGFNTYTAKVSFSPNKAGSGKAPAPIGFTERYTAGGTGGNRTAPLTDIKTKVYGVVADGKSFPTCSLAKIQAAKSDAGCPKGAMIASGSIKALLGPTADPSATAPGVVPCDPLLHVWNGGQGKTVFFFVETAPNHTCANGAITTGTVGPYPGTVKTVGKMLVLDTPVPGYVSFPLAGVEGSLTELTLHFKNLTRTVKGKTAAYTASTACNKGKRPYSVTFTASMNGQSQSDTVSGTQKCR